jgi:hypothetical protein
MSEKPDEDFEDGDADELPLEADDLDLDRVTKDLELARKRAQKGDGDPAWRRLEQLLEQKQTAELTSDFEDYDIGLPETGRRARRPHRRDDS